MSTATSAKAASFVTRLDPESMLDATGIGNSQVSIVEAGRLALVAGQTATRTDGKPVSPDLAGQARLVAAQLAIALREFNASSSDVVAFRMYIVDATKERFKKAWSPIREMHQGQCRVARRSVCKDCGRLRCRSRSK